MVLLLHLELPLAGGLWSCGYGSGSAIHTGNVEEIDQTICGHVGLITFLSNWFHLEYVVKGQHVGCFQTRDSRGKVPY